MKNLKVLQLIIILALITNIRNDSEVTSSFKINETCLVKNCSKCEVDNITKCIECKDKYEKINQNNIIKCKQRLEDNVFPHSRIGKLFTDNLFFSEKESNEKINLKKGKSN